MEITSLAYKKFIKSFVEEFLQQYLDDLINVFHVDKSNKNLIEYYKDIELLERIKDELSYNITPIAKDLGIGYLETLDLQEDKNFLRKVFNDVTTDIEKRLQERIVRQ